MSNRRPVRSALGSSAANSPAKGGSQGPGSRRSRPARQDGSPKKGDSSLASAKPAARSLARLFALPRLGVAKTPFGVTQVPFLATASEESAAGNRILPLVHPSSDQQEKICSAIGLSLKVGLSLVAAVSLVRLAGAYQERLDRNGEITAILAIEQAKLNKAEDHFDRLFATGGEQRLIREQDQWIAPDRLRIVWERSDGLPTVESPGAKANKVLPHP